VNELALFAGSGGGILGGVLSGFRTVCAVEWDAYCQAVLLARQADGLLERFPIWDNVRTFQGADWRGKVDVITAGFPCQPFSSAGKRKGEGDDRNGWPDTIRIIREVGPRYALLENVPGLLNWDGGRYFGEILGELSESGFDARWKVISANEIGAPHKRDRLWILAYSNKCGRRAKHGKQQDKRPTEPDSSGEGNVANSDASGERGNQRKGEVEKDAELSNPAGTRRATRTSEGQSGGCGEVADTEKSNSRRLPLGKKPEQSEPRIRSIVGDPASQGLSDGPKRTIREPRQEQELKRSDWWTVEPALGRVAHGVAHRVDRLKAIGNGQVAGVAASAWRILSEGLEV
jgi:DNA (cytosine-5)-methyltransferase 1